MNKIECNRIKNNIINKLEEILEQVENLNLYPNKIPQIDIDIVMGNVRTLYEQFYALNKVNSGLISDENLEIESKPVKSELTSKEEVQKKTELTPEMEALEAELLKAPAPVAKNEESIQNTIQKPESKEITEEVKEEVTSQFSQEHVVENTKPQTLESSLFDVEPEKNEPNSSDLFTQEQPTQATIVDKYKNETKSINDKLQKDKQDKSIGSRMQKNPIKDLKIAIGINEKFLFINELFKGDMKNYTDTILQLNNMTHLEEAKDILNSLSQKYNWDKTSLPYQTFMNYIERKLI